MSDDALARRIEQRSLRFGIGANAVMTLAGFVAHVLTGSSALLLDGHPKIGLPPHACVDINR